MRTGMRLSITAPCQRLRHVELEAPCLQGMQNWHCPTCVQPLVSSSIHEGLIIAGPTLARTGLGARPQEPLKIKNHSGDCGMTRKHIVQILKQ